MSKVNRGTQFGLLGFINPMIPLRLLKRLPSIAPQRYARLAGVVGAGVGMLPLVAAQKVFNAQQTEPRPLERSPVFIIGHWRSGTTHLHNLLSQDTQFGCVRMFETVAPQCSLITRGWLPQLMDRVMPSKRPMDNLGWPMDAPQEEEIALAKLTPYSWYLQFLFPQNAIPTFNSHVLPDGLKPGAKEEVKRNLQHIFQVALCHEAHRAKCGASDGTIRLLSKNPVNTARIPLLLEMFPDARFVYLHRSPLDVFVSSKNLHRKILELTSLQNYTEADIERNVLEIYPTLINRYLKDRALLRDDQLVEVAFSDLEADPKGTVEGIYRQLRLPGFVQAERKIAAYVDSQVDYQKNSFARLTHDEVLRVRERWRSGFAAGGYPDPLTPDGVSGDGGGPDRPRPEQSSQCLPKSVA